MVDLYNSGDSDEIDSDEELQQAFAEGKLKDGLNVALPAPKKQINNVAGMKQKLKQLENSLSWVERLDVTNDPAPAPAGAEEMELQEGAGDEDVHNDFKRELRFYRQAQASVLEAIPKLHELGVKTRRPEDYFAEMAKTDMHMKKVREKLLEKQQGIEQRDKARKMRELRKYGKKVQQEVILKRQKEKKEMLDAVKKFRKGQKDKLDFLEDDGKKKKGGGGSNKDENNFQQNRTNKKRQFKNSKYGYGGQKKRSKLNTKESARDMSDFSVKTNQGRPGSAKKKFVNRNKNKRPGKTKRATMKNKKR